MHEEVGSQSFRMKGRKTKVSVFKGQGLEQGRPSLHCEDINSTVFGSQTSFMTRGAPCWGHGHSQGILRKDVQESACREEKREGGRRHIPAFKYRYGPLVCVYTGSLGKLGWRAKGWMPGETEYTCSSFQS